MHYHTLSSLKRDLKKLKKMRSNYSFGSDQQSLWSKLKNSKKAKIIGGTVLGLGAAGASAYLLNKNLSKNPSTTNVNSKPVVQDKQPPQPSVKKDTLSEKAAGKVINFATTRNHQGNGIFSSMIDPSSWF